VSGLTGSCREPGKPSAGPPPASPHQAPGSVHRSSQQMRDIIDITASRPLPKQAEVQGVPWPIGLSSARGTAREGLHSQLVATGTFVHGLALLQLITDWCTLVDVVRDSTGCRLTVNPRVAQ
jgi:hypothetical protein